MFFITQSIRHASWAQQNITQGFGLRRSIIFFFNCTYCRGYLEVTDWISFSSKISPLFRNPNWIVFIYKNDISEHSNRYNGEIIVEKVALDYKNEHVTAYPRSGSHSTQFYLIHFSNYKSANHFKPEMKCEFAYNLAYEKTQISWIVSDPLRG